MCHCMCNDWLVIALCGHLLAAMSIDCAVLVVSADAVPALLPREIMSHYGNFWLDGVHEAGRS